MGPVPCIALRDLWDRSHVWLSETHGTGPIAQLGLHIITSLVDNFTRMIISTDLACVFSKCVHLCSQIELSPLMRQMASHMQILIPNIQVLSSPLPLHASELFRWFCLKVLAMFCARSLSRATSTLR